MRDEVLDNYMKELVQLEIDEKKFQKYIDVFSRFLGYVNFDYKYSGIYLSQYINDFEDVYQGLKEKNYRYKAIFQELKKMGKDFELNIDGIYFVQYNFKNDSYEEKYIGIDKYRIINKVYEVRITLLYNENEYLFCKEYKNCDDLLEKVVREDVNEYIKIKKLEDKP